MRIETILTISALYKPNKLSLNSFLLNHSTAYHAAVIAGLAEYLIEWVNLYDEKFYPVSELCCYGDVLPW